MRAGCSVIIIITIPEVASVCGWYPTLPRAAAGSACSHCQARTPRETLTHSRTEPLPDTAELPTTTPV
ncbi:hypothetical protein PFLUV_G00053270 [Perca fluviatilis]|uniref:Uncharacterized protein n=1 Tax=Perca fluviatilis TaxID=8168 RepID=A0A6A5F586_PERFL|nr:hypothetical protein PFLUV_G00053270 [Perca fluviatilis]